MNAAVNQQELKQDILKTKEEIELLKEKIELADTIKEEKKLLQRLKELQCLQLWRLSWVEEKDII